MPTHTERTAAAAVHISDAFFPVVGPAVALLTFGRQSPYVRSHAVKAIRGWLILKLVLLAMAAVSITFTIQRFMDHGIQLADLEGLVVRMVLSWLLLSILEFFNVIQALRQAWRAYQGN
jgi:uncharacterized membrane protein